MIQRQTIGLGDTLIAQSVVAFPGFEPRQDSFARMHWTSSIRWS
jgi:hypothetical protein